MADTGTGTPWEKYLTWVSIEEQALAPGSTLEALIEQTDPVAVGEISEDTTTVDGVAAYERVYEKFHGEPLRKTREVWLEKGGTVYTIVCWSTPGHFDGAPGRFRAHHRHFPREVDLVRSGRHLGAASSCRHRGRCCRDNE